jgi:phage terminase large subunit
LIPQTPLRFTKAFNKIAALHKSLRIVAGGTSASKTVSILQYLILYAKNRKLRISIVADTNQKLIRGAYTGEFGFIDILKKMGMYDPKCHNLTKQTYQLNESLFEFFPAETEFSGRRDILYVNEANFIHFHAFEELKARTNLFTIIDFNPTTEFYVHTEFIGKVDCDFITLTYKDNDFLNQKTIDEIESWEKLGETSEFYANRWRVMGLGQLGIQSGAIYTDWKEIETLADNAELLASGLDFGYSNDACALISVYRFDQQLIVDEVIYETGLLPRDLAAKILDSKARYQIIYADSAEPKSIDDLRSYGINVLPVVKSKDSINYGIQLIQEQPILITSRSKNLLKEISAYVWKKDRNGNQLTVTNGVDDGLDALRYVFLMKFSKKSNTYNLKWKR